MPMRTSLQGPVEQLIHSEAGDGDEFDRWFGDTSGADNQITVGMDSDRSVAAHFEKTGGGLPLFWIGVRIGIVVLLAVAVFYWRQAWSE
ncbi:hypothetical protein AKJ64_03040 [candidate division MSBL1 archaeon SCGC-AAA259E17]|uniref:Uncharacterized protein n=1 Tax=candidate division MSBL1 archaeon SCGC-AAA259E17 TaxID=1698263 RepID=A0A133UE31_9EURY|nr:hypothetical protein AKJ64_03040 [candidate division MSBL1 archaeon SCGC-AAA259E17]